MRRQRWNRSRSFCALCGLSLAATAASFIATTASAAPIVYGNRSGATVDYLDIQEETLSAGDANGLFGAPTVSANSLDFDPIGFTSQASNNSNDITDVELKFKVDAKPNNVINFLHFAEAGDATLTRSPAAAPSAFASVTTNLHIDVVEVNGAPINVVSGIASLSFSPTGGQFSLGGGFPISNIPWTGSANIDINALLAANSISGQATLIHVTLDNTLATAAGADNTAFIAKKNAHGVVITVDGLNPFPEPASGLMAGLALIGGLAARRRRS